MDVIQVVEERDIVIVGLPLRTHPQRAAAEIPAHWQRFHAEQVSRRIPVRADDAHVYCVYCDYESDYRAAYTMLIGHAVDPQAAVPEGLRRVRIPAGRYAQFSFEGDPQQVITQTWNAANERWDGRQRRRYIADFERYAPGAMTPEHVTGRILIGID